MEIKAAPYNVVLDDDTFKGELKLGLRFIATVSNSLTIQDIKHRQYIPNNIESLKFSIHKTFFL